MLKEEVDEEDVAEIVSKWTGIPVSRLMEGEMSKLVRMEDVLHSASSARTRRSPRSPTPSVAAAPACPTRTGRSARSCSSGPPASARPSSPAASPTSCSTTSGPWSASTCREYKEKHTVSRLVGAPPGYVGYEEGGQLTEAVRRRPYAVVLLDEIEKAHPDVFNVLLQLLDDGRLTDGQGRTVDFTNTVLIMTSNLGGGADEAHGDERGAATTSSPSSSTASTRSWCSTGSTRRTSSASSTSRSSSCGSGWRSADLGLELTDAARAHIAHGGLRPRLRGAAAEAGASSARSATRWRSRCSRASSTRATSIVVDANADGQLTFSAKKPVTID